MIKTESQLRKEIKILFKAYDYKITRISKDYYSDDLIFTITVGLIENYILEYPYGVTKPIIPRLMKNGIHKASLSYMEKRNIDHDMIMALGIIKLIKEFPIPKQGGI